MANGVYLAAKTLLSTPDHTLVAIHHMLFSLDEKWTDLPAGFSRRQSYIILLEVAAGSHE